MKIPVGFILGVLLGYTLSWTVRVSFELPDWSSSERRSAVEGHFQTSNPIAEAKRTILHDHNNNNDNKDFDVSSKHLGVKRRDSVEDTFDEFNSDVENVEPVNVVEEGEDAGQSQPGIEENKGSSSLQVITVTRPHVCKKGKYLIGVLVASDRLLSMAYAIHSTWGNVEGVKIFSAASIDPSHLPTGVVVSSLSSQSEKKLLDMIQQMQPASSSADWIVLTQDSVYVQVAKLEEYLGGLDPSKEVYIGLSSSSEQCSFTSALIVSRTAFAKLSSKLVECSTQYSRQSGDVEGDSILRQCMVSIGIKCTPPVSSSKVYHTDQELWSSSELFSTDITEHVFLSPMEYPKYVYRVHIYFQIKKLTQMHEEVDGIRDQIEVLQHFVPTRLRSQVDLVKPPSSSDSTSGSNSPVPFVRPMQMLDIANWEFFNQSKIMNAINMYPAYSLTGQTRTELKWALTQGLAQAKKMSEERVSFVQIDSAYRRVSPSKGLEWIMDFILKNSAGSRSKKRVGLYLPFASSPQVFSNAGGRKTPVNFLTTISRVGLRLTSFLAMFYKLYVREKGRITLTIVLFKGPDEEEVLSTVNTFARDMTLDKDVVRVHTIAGEFARGVGLAEGMKLFQDSDLVFIVDIDLVVDGLFLDRCQYNTIEGKQVYFPIFFKLYSQPFVRENVLTKDTLPVITRNNGHWAHYSYGMLCVYASDYRKTAGYQTELRGWGEEDIQFVNEVLKMRFEVFRSPDPALLHLWHDKTCDPQSITSENVLYHCRRSKAENIADRIELANHLFKLWSEHPELKPSL